MEKEYWRNVTSTVILAVLIILSFLLLKPILFSIIIGIILAFVFSPLYKVILKFIPSKNLSVSITGLILILLLIIPLWFLIPILLNQSIQIFIASQGIDLVTPLQKLFPSMLSSEMFSNQVGSSMQNFITKITSSVMTGIASFISNFPTILLKTLVVFFTFFFTLRDNEKFTQYIQSVLPFSKEVEKKLFKSSRDITFSVLYGQVILGIAQGILVGVGFYLFGIENALFLTILACLAGIFPIIGTSVVWIPVMIFALMKGNQYGALGILFFGIICIFVENVLKPMFISKRTNVHSAIILLGMIGGLFLFGILGFIIGPLILSYLLIVLELYRDKKVPGVFINPPK